MFSVIFPGQGSQFVGMGSNFYEKYDLFKYYFNEADKILKFPLSKIILEGPKEELNLTENTQPAIFLVTYCIFKLVEEEFKLNLYNSIYFAGHSLGEYSALSCAKSIDFDDAISLLNKRGKAMQSCVPNGRGGMLAVLGSNIESLEKIIIESQLPCYIANDNSINQIVVSGLISDIKKLVEILSEKKIKNLILPVSAPFHCRLMRKATNVMKLEIDKIKFKNPVNPLISNVTGLPIKDPEQLKNALIDQIESRVRWRESVQYMIEKKTNHFIEIGPGKILSNLIKRIDKNIKVSTINSEDDIRSLNIND